MRPSCMNGPVCNCASCHVCQLRICACASHHMSQLRVCACAYVTCVTVTRVCHHVSQLHVCASHHVCRSYTCVRVRSIMCVSYVCVRVHPITCVSYAWVRVHPVTCVLLPGQGRVLARGGVMSCPPGFLRGAWPCAALCSSSWS